jgi:hypothetical protein
MEIERDMIIPNASETTLLANNKNEIVNINLKTGKIKEYT